MNEIKCANMTSKPTCAGEVTHIDRKGFLYCASCAATRARHSMACRTLRQAEMKKLRNHEPIRY